MQRTQEAPAGPRSVSGPGRLQDLFGLLGNQHVQIRERCGAPQENRGVSLCPEIAGRHGRDRLGGRQLQYLVSSS